MSFVTVISVLTPALILYGLYTWTGFISKGLPLPPGPRGDPIIGHIRIVPQTHSWIRFTEWMKFFGSIIYVHILGKPLIVLNSFEVAKELLDKRGAIYSDRPRLVLIQEMMGMDNIIIFMRYGDRFKKHRKLIQQAFNAQNSTSYRPMQRRETHILLQNLLKDPADFEVHIERAISGSIVATAYGHQVNSNDDEYVHLAKGVSSLVVESGSAGATLVDFFPILRYIPSWMPGGGLTRFASKTHKLFLQAMNRPFDMVMERRLNGTAQHSMVNYLLEQYEQEGKKDEDHVIDIKCTASSLYGAAVETTIGAIMTFLLAMITHPEVAKKAQQEIDDIIGNDRLPEFEDRDSLPYMNCVLKEIYRWNPPLPLGLPHNTLKSDVYEGMQIPENAMIISNIWAMMMDSSLYEEPKKFNPDRFMNRNDQDDVREAGYSVFDPESKVFGFGRRICPGRFYADAGLWLTIVCVLAAFDILPPLNSDGDEEMPSVEFTGGMTSQPVPFRCRFILRKPSYASLILHLKDVIS